MLSVRTEVTGCLRTRGTPDQDAIYATFQACTHHRPSLYELRGTSSGVPVVSGSSRLTLLMLASPRWCAHPHCEVFKPFACANHSANGAVVLLEPKLH